MIWGKCAEDQNSLVWLGGESPFGENKAYQEGEKRHKVEQIYKIVLRFTSHGPDCAHTWMIIMLKLKI